MRNFHTMTNIFVMKCNQRLHILLLFLITAMASMAQSTMTDSQIQDYIAKEVAKGTERSTIVSNLIEKGVTVDRIQKIKRNFEKQKNKSVVGAKDITGASSRTRTPNGQQREEKVNTNFPTRGKKKVDTNNMTPQERMKYKQSQIDEIDDEADFLFPDTLRYYDDYEEETEMPAGKKVFGRDIFNNKQLTFEPEMNIATPADYRLGPGDAVNVDVWGSSTKSYECTVSPDGYINLEDFGPVNVSGLTVSQANSRVKGILSSHFAGSNVRLSVGQTKTITVNVMGEVQMPGTYTLSAFATVFHALYMAGGTNDIGTMRDIKVFRSGRCISTVDIYDYILNGNLSGNVRLTSNDVIVVGPYDCLVNLTGKVKRPMWYEMKQTESLGTLLKYAGGFAGDAYEENITVVRKKGGVKRVFSVGEFDRNAFQLCDADSVSVDSTLNRFENTVEVKGAVMRPGYFQIDGDMATVRQLIEKSGGLSEDAMTTRGIIHRRKENRSLEVISFNTAALLAHEVADITLKNEDVVFIPSHKDQEEERVLVINGEVIYPGTYEYAEGTTIEDLILQAGGMKDNASVTKIDVMRRHRDNYTLTAPETVGEFFTFCLKDGFIVDGNEGFMLQPFDEVYVRQSPGNNEQQHVTVVGEATFVGVYGLTKKNSRLSDIVKQCGGVTAQAYLKGARLQRQMTEEDKAMQRALLKIASTGDSIDVKKLEIGDTKYIGINLDKAIENPGDDRYDIILQDGDILTIPQYNNTVTVNGEVMYPNTVAYIPEAPLSYYINQSGGFNLRAKESRVFAINMNGTVTRVRSRKDIQPGCNIVVPAKGKRNRMTTAQILSLSMSFASLGAVIASAINNMKK